MSDLRCFGSNYRPNEGPDHQAVRNAVKILKQHLHAEWISEGCEADHAFGCPSCQAVLLERELDGLIGWLDDSAVTDDIPA